MDFFDSHAHLSSSDVIGSIEAILARAKIAGVCNMLNICTDPQTLRDGLALSEKYSEIKNAGCTPPHDVEKDGALAFPIFERAALEKKLVAIGETGLEYFHPGLDRDMQKEYLIKYLHLALKVDLPVIFHCREAFDDLFAITDVEYSSKARAVLHCFTGTLKEAEKVLSRGWYLSLSGIVTFKKSEALREVAKMVPLDQLLIETDSPYLAPLSRRGRPNEPAFLLETAQCIANVKGISIEQLALSTTNNAKRLFC